MLGGTNILPQKGPDYKQRKVEAMEKQVEVSTEKLEVMKAIENADDTQVMLVSAFIAGIKVNLIDKKETA